MKDNSIKENLKVILVVVLVIIIYIFVKSVFFPSQEDACWKGCDFYHNLSVASDEDTAGQCLDKCEQKYGSDHDYPI